MTSQAVETFIKDAYKGTRCGLTNVVVTADDPTHRLALITSTSTNQSINDFDETLTECLHPYVNYAPLKSTSLDTDRLGMPSLVTKSLPLYSTSRVMTGRCAKPLSVPHPPALPPR